MLLSLSLSELGKHKNAILNLYEDIVSLESNYGLNTYLPLQSGGGVACRECAQAVRLCVRACVHEAVHSVSVSGRHEVVQ